MKYERELQQLVSVLEQAQSGISLWLPFLNPDEVEGLMDAAHVIQQAKATALKRHNESSAGGPLA
jgi:spore cortex formation protein SpoVR/YcgB (stage V sporulation)